MIERPAVRLHLDGQGGLIAPLTPLQARVLFRRLVAVNRLTRHERALFYFDPVEEPPLPQRLRFQRPPLPISAANLRRMEGLCSSRLLDGAWRLDETEGRLHQGTLPGRRPGSTRRCQYAPLFGMIFEVERISVDTLLLGGPRDVLAQRADRSLALLRFEGVEAHQGGLSLALRDRARLARSWHLGVNERSERALLRWFAIRAAHPQPGFSLTCVGWASG